MIIAIKVVMWFPQIVPFKNTTVSPKILCVIWLQIILSLIWICLQDLFEFVVEINFTFVSNQWLCYIEIESQDAHTSVVKK